MSVMGVHTGYSTSVYTGYIYSAGVCRVRAGVCRGQHGCAYWVQHGAYTGFSAACSAMHRGPCLWARSYHAGQWAS